jgi:phosphoglycerol transferase
MNAAAISNDPLGPRYESTLAEGIIFSKQGYPGFLNKVTGVSGYEPWGRWTDGKEAKLQFKTKLPAKFELELTAGAFGPNLNAPLTIKIGKVSKSITLTDINPKTYKVSFEGVTSDTLTLMPAKPTSPKSVGANEDLRMLGVSLVRLKIQ